MIDRESGEARSKADSDLVVQELRKTNHLLALILVKGMPQRDAIGVLDAAGFTPKQIAAAIGMTANAVSVALHRMRKAAAKPITENRDGGLRDQVLL